jgi:hypothetical protein
MLNAGAVTRWEPLNGHASLSHAWSSGTTFDLTTCVLGVQPTRPAVGLGATRLTGERGTEDNDLREGRARYGLTDPGSFRVESIPSTATREEGDR